MLPVNQKIYSRKSIPNQNIKTLPSLPDGFSSYVFAYDALQNILPAIQILLGQASILAKAHNFWITV